MRVLALLRVLLGTALLTGCAAHAAPIPERSASPSQIERLVRSNPLYSELVHYDRAIAALQRTDATWPARERAAAIYRGRADAAASFARAAQRLSAAGDTAAVTIAREHALLAALSAAPQSPAALASAFRNDLMEEQRRSIDQLRSDYNNRVVAAYGRRRQQLAESESALALELVRSDATHTMLLKMRSDELGSDPIARRAAAEQLSAIERSNAAQIAALRVRNGAKLAAYRAQFAREASSEEARTIAQIEQRITANLAARTTSPATQTGPLQADSVALARSQPAAQSEARNARIAFAQAETSLGIRDDSLARVDDGATRSIDGEISLLRQERAELYDALVAWARARLAWRPKMWDSISGQR